MSRVRSASRPYFQIYGELFLEDIVDDSDCIGAWAFTSCGFKVTWLVPFLMAGYLLLTNILLINLLIAMFNDTVSADRGRVQSAGRS